MSKWFNIRMKTEAQNFNAVRSKIMGWPIEVLDNVYRPALEGIAAGGVAYIRSVIDTSTTPTGQRRRARGEGEAGRIETGRMKQMVRARIRPRKDGFSMFVGWIDGRPGYAIFQELGTAQIEAMNAIPQAQEWMLSELRKLNVQGGRYQGSTFEGF